MCTKMETGYGRAVYRFDTNVEGELPLAVGDVVRIDNKVDENWLRGTKLGGIQGIFPASFVVRIEIRPLQSHEKLFIAIETFPSLQSGDLGFLKGDFIICNRKIDSNWLEGESSGRHGIFPSNFVREIPHQTLTLTSVGQSMSLNGHTSLTSTDHVSSTLTVSQAIVQTDLVAKLPDELTLKKGETVFIDEYIDKNWCRGRTMDGRSGIFPKGFVQEEKRLINQQQDAQKYFQQKPDAKPTLSSSKLPSPLPNYTDAVTTLTQTSPTTINVAHIADRRTEDVQPYGKTKYNFVAEYPEELSFTANQIIKLVKHIDDEWTLGELNYKKGIFPTSYVDIIVDCPKGTERKTSHFGGDSTNVSSREVYEVLFDFVGTVSDDLQSLVGDNVELVRRIDDSWIEGRNMRTRQTGLIPLNFLKVVSSGHAILRDDSRNQPQQRPQSLNDSISANMLQLEHSRTVDAQQARTMQHNEQQEHHLYPDIRNVRLSTPPARPTTSPALKKPIQEDLEQQKRQKEEQKKLEVRAQRMKIFEEILQTERDYGVDLVICQEVLGVHRNALDVDILLAGLPSIVLLSKKLLHGLEAEFGKDFVYQEIGTPFLNLQEEFKLVYGGFCETHEDVQMLLEKYETEPAKQYVLKDCLQKIQQRTTCMDLNSLLSRPTQRVLKYPLFLSEVLKCTESNQSDKVKLMMALKVMTEVAQCINETKRRKEMVSKYRKDGDANFSERLSRFNMHTFRKKSSRLSIRLSTTMGLTQAVKDDEFDEAERNFHLVEKSCRTFVRDVQAYCEQMLVFFNQQMSIAENLHHGVNAKTQKTETYFEAWSKVLFSEAVLQRFFDAVNEKVRFPVSSVQQMCKGPEKLVVKRRDKMLDFEAATSKYEKEKGRGDSADPARLRILEEEYRKAKNEYEAMNTQLKNELPQLCNLAYDILSMATKAFVAAQRSWVYDLSRQFQPLERLIGGHTANVDLLLETFTKNNQFVSNELAKITFLPVATTTTAAVGRSPTISKKSIEIVRVNNIRSNNHIVFPQKPQTESDRQILRTKYDEKQLYVATSMYQPDNDMDIALKNGDMVGVIVNKDPMGNDHRWFVDNGVGKGFVPRTILRKYEEETSVAPAFVPPNVAFNSSIKSLDRQKTVTNTRVDVPRPSAVKPSQKPDNFPVLSEKKIITRSFTASESSLHQSSESTRTKPSEPVRPKLVPARVAPAPPPVPIVSMQPTRSAPPPPKKEDKHPESTSPRVVDKQPEVEYSAVHKRHDKTPVDEEEKFEFYVVVYDFAARTANEVKVTEGQLVAVHARQDLENNSDWWLVESEEGDIGYVPANYLTPYNNP